MTNNEIYHFGVKGMKWGVRKKISSVSSDSTKLNQIRKKKISEMSNAELKDANYRLNLERQYKDLTRKKNKGKEAVQTFIKVAGTIVAVEAAAKTYKRVGNSAIDKIGKIAINSLIK